MIELEAGLKFTPDAQRAATIAGMLRVDAHFVLGTFADMPAITKVMQSTFFGWSLHPPASRGRIAN
jgi:hypothetical protein